MSVNEESRPSPLESNLEAEPFKLFNGKQYIKWTNFEVEKMLFEAFSFFLRRYSFI